MDNHIRMYIMDIPFSFPVKFKVNMAYFMVLFVGEEMIENAIREQIPVAAPVVDPKYVQDVRIYDADGEFHVFI